MGVERDDKAAVEWFRRGADAGHPGSMYSLGLMYQKGRGVAKDAAEALRWFEKAAAGGYARANDAIRALRHQASAQKRAAPAPPAAPKEIVSTDLQLARRYRGGTAAERAEALKIYQRLAETGNGTAQLSLGDMYRDGIGTAPDPAQAVAWYERAAQQGRSMDSFRLGDMYLKVAAARDRTVGQSIEKAAAQGDTTAQLRLASLYLDAAGGEPDYAKVATLYQTAAEHGSASAAQRLGAMYMKGLGVDSDDREAVAWFRHGAEKGHAGSMYSLGLMYEKGRGVGKDTQEALRWYRGAAAAGYTRASPAIQRLERKMSLWSTEPKDEPGRKRQ
jgi:TPR repeat protein